MYNDALSYYLRSNSFGNLERNTYLKIGNCHYFLKDYTNAKSAYYDLIKLNPDSEYGNHYYARMLVQLGKSDEAYEHIEVALKNKREEATREGYENDRNFETILTEDRFVNLLDQYFN